MLQNKFKAKHLVPKAFESEVIQKWFVAFSFFRKVHHQSSIFRGHLKPQQLHFINYRWRRRKTHFPDHCCLFWSGKCFFRRCRFYCQKHRETQGKTLDNSTCPKNANVAVLGDPLFVSTRQRLWRQYLFPASSANQLWTWTWTLVSAFSIGYSADAYRLSSTSWVHWCPCETFLT